MRKRKINIQSIFRVAVLVLLTSSPILSNAQTDMQLSHQLFNRVYYNPAAAGASQYINGIAIARQQWAGFSGAPKQIVFSADGYIPSLKSGLGLSAVVDKLGLENSINVNASYAYHIRFGSNTNLSFGLGIGILHRGVDRSKAIFSDNDPSDPDISAFLQEGNKTELDFNFGIELNHENFTFGAAVTHLNHSSTVRKDLVSGRHFYAYGRYRVELVQDWDLVPTLSAQNNIKSTQMEANLMAFYKKRYWFGAAYRVNEKLIAESVVGMLGLYVTDFLRLGYSYDLNVGDLGSYSSGSHEIMLGFRIKPQTRSYNKTPRLFLEY